MAEKPKQTAKVDLAGRLYRRGGRWWWSVRLPGEARARSRPLCQQGQTEATQNRSIAEQAALRLWQNALVRESEARIKTQSRSQAQEKSKAYAYLIDILCEGILCNPRLARSLSVPPQEAVFVAKAVDETMEETLSHESVDIVEAPSDLGHVSDISDLLSWLSKGQYDRPRQTGCDCCGDNDFYEEYLHRIESGQRLCPRCYKAFQEKARLMERSVCRVR